MTHWWKGGGGGIDGNGADSMGCEGGNWVVVGRTMVIESFKPKSERHRADLVTGSVRQ